MSGHSGFDRGGERFTVLMKRKLVGAVAACLCLCLGPVAAAEVAAVESPAADTAAPAQLPGLGQADTLRSNLWLTEALMAEIVTASSRELPPSPGRILLVDDGGTDADLIFGTVASGILLDRGYEVFLPTAEDSTQTESDYIYRFRVDQVGLSYPDVGRTLGIWRRWVARDLAVSAVIEIAATASGRLYLNDRLERRYSDRIEDGDFGRVDSAIYPFTTAETSESGWQRRAEEIVVLGTLVGLIAVYFANTGN